MSGITSYLAGEAAEDTVARAYIAHGYALIDQRWRGKAGEIDLIFQKDAEIIFVEVKKSRSFDAAAFSLGARQIRRLLASAEDFLGRMPKQSMTPARFDVALVNATGQLKVLPNALAA
ncbi:YraN family protein [Gymnodinialimonas sp. 2305UL16-5]|uniref:YraN family protein n=1 Tax=Gymnodinialimonas mytili TaxID=3126503 RepID=UPI00309D4118